MSPRIDLFTLDIEEEFEDVMVKIVEKGYSRIPVYKDNIDQILGSKSLSANNMFEEMCRDGIIEVEAMAFIQGRSIPRSIIILDEAENISPREARMVVERCGKDSKVILLGDLSQVENPYLDAKSNGLSHAISGGKKSDLVSSVTLSKVERSELAAVASEIFNRPEARRN